MMRSLPTVYFSTFFSYFFFLTSSCILRSWLPISNCFFFILTNAEKAVRSNQRNSKSVISKLIHRIHSECLWMSVVSIRYLTAGCFCLKLVQVWEYIASFLFVYTVHLKSVRTVFFSGIFFHIYKNGLCFLRLVKCPFVHNTNEERRSHTINNLFSASTSVRPLLCGKWLKNYRV